MFPKKLPVKFITAITLLIAMFAGLSTGWYYTPKADAQVLIEQNTALKEKELSEDTILDKISDDPELEMAMASDDTVRVIVQTKATPKAGLSSAIMFSGGMVTRTYQNFN